MVDLIPCKSCGRDCYPNQLEHSAFHGGKICNWCQSDPGDVRMTHGESQAEKRRQAQKAAWNGGEGWGN